MKSSKNKNISEKNGLSHKQHLAVAELLNPSNKSYEDVARACGKSSCRLFNWRKEPKFQEAIESGVNGLKERVLKAADFSMQIDSVNSMLDY